MARIMKPRLASMRMRRSKGAARKSFKKYERMMVPRSRRIRGA